MCGVSWTSFLHAQSVHVVAEMMVTGGMEMRYGKVPTSYETVTVTLNLENSSLPCRQDAMLCYGDPCDGTNAGGG
jgi:hypothetical protein